MQHEQFEELLDTLAKHSGVGQEVLGEVLARTSLRAPFDTSRVEIAMGNPAARRPVDQHAIPQGTVSKAVKALIEEGLLEDGEHLMKTRDGRPVLPLRFGRGYSIAGVKVVQSHEWPTRVRTALFGLDSTRKLGDAESDVNDWDQVAEVIHRHVTDLKKRCDEDRGRERREPLRLFGVGVEVGAPVHDGKVMSLSSDKSKAPVQLAAELHRLFDADPRFSRPLPVIVENDVNALAVLATHQIHYTDPDLVVVAVMDEGVGGGLVMDGRVRRGGNGRAMEIGHLSVSFPPGEDPEPARPHGGLAADDLPWLGDAGFDAPCSCGGVGHVDTHATPSRIAAELKSPSFDELCEIEAGDPRFEAARDVFARGGAALGRALAHVSNTVNPSRVLMYVPAALHEPKPETPAAAYNAAVRAEVCRAFAARDQEDYLKPVAFATDPQEVALLGAKAAAVCLLESFIEHALRLDGCKTGLRRTAVGSHSSE